MNLVFISGVSPILALHRCKLPATMAQNVRKCVRVARERELQKAAQQDEVETLRASARLVAETERATKGRPRVATPPAAAVAATAATTDVVDTSGVDAQIAALFEVRKAMLARGATS